MTDIIVVFVLTDIIVVFVYPLKYLLVVIIQRIYHIILYISLHTIYIYTILQCRRIHIYTHILHKVYLREYSQLKLKLSSLAGKSRGTFLDGSALHPNSASHDFLATSQQESHDQNHIFPYEDCNFGVDPRFSGPTQSRLIRT